MNPLIYIDDGSEDPRGNWKDDHFGPLKGRCFNIVRDFPSIFLKNVMTSPKTLRFLSANRWKSHLKGIRGAIRYRQWKLHTGIGSKKDEDKKSGWEIAPGREEGFIAFDDDYEDMTGKYYQNQISVK